MMGIGGLGRGGRKPRGNLPPLPSLHKYKSSGCNQNRVGKSVVDRETLDAFRRSKLGASMAADISVVIPTFRRPALLKEAIESVLAQHVQVEIIVVDDSPERSAEPMAKGFGSKVQYLDNPNPTGGWPSRVRNLGWPRATAPLIHFLDDDDRVPLGHYLKAIDTFAMHSDVGVVFGVVAPFSAEGQRIEHEVSFFSSSARRARAAARLGPKLGFSMQMFFHPTLLVCAAAMVRTEVVKALSGFDPNARLVEDVEFYARAIRRSGAKFLDRKVLDYRIGPTSLMRGKPSGDEVSQTYQLMYKSYRRDHGSSELLALKLLARTLGKLV
jgi:glycosyltransferase involved in cell wall biosynthesis